MDWISNTFVAIFDILRCPIISTPKSSPIMYIMKKTPAKPMKPVPSKSYPSHFRFWLQQKCFEIVSKHGRNSTCIFYCWFLARNSNISWWEKRAEIMLTEISSIVSSNSHLRWKNCQSCKQTLMNFSEFYFESESRFASTRNPIYASSFTIFWHYFQ